MGEGGHAPKKGHNSKSFYYENMKAALTLCLFSLCHPAHREDLHRNIAFKACSPPCPINHYLDIGKLNGSAQQQWHITRTLPKDKQTVPSQPQPNTCSLRTHSHQPPERSGRQNCYQWVSQQRAQRLQVAKTAALCKQQGLELC